MSAEDTALVAPHKVGLTELTEADLKEALECEDREDQAKRGSSFSRPADIQQTPKIGEAVVFRNRSRKEVLVIVATDPHSLRVKGATQKQTAGSSRKAGASAGVNCSFVTASANTEGTKNKSAELEVQLECPPSENVSRVDMKQLLVKSSKRFPVETARGRFICATFLFDYQAQTSTYSRYCFPERIPAGSTFTLRDELFQTPQYIDHGVSLDTAKKEALQHANSLDGVSGPAEGAAAAPSAAPTNPVQRLLNSFS